VLEYIPDGDLSEWRVANWALEVVEDNMRLFCTKLLHSILYLHSLGILHRDLKPSNVLLRRSSVWSEKRARQTLLAFDPVLSDFGTAAAGDSDLYSQQFQTYAGTPWFMAPEVKRQTPAKPAGGYDAKADVWSFGVLLLMLYVGLKGITASTSLESLMSQYRHTMSDEFSNLLDRMLTHSSELRMSWDDVASHTWFKFPEVHAHEWMEAQEALPQCDEMMRPANVDPLHLRCDATLDSPQGSAFFSLLDAKDLVLSTQKRLSALHSEWTTNKQRFYTLYMRPWDDKLLSIQSTLAFYQPFRHIVTMRTIFSIAQSYGPSMARFLMLLEVGRVCMETIKSFESQPPPSDPTHVRAALQTQWQVLFEDTQRLIIRSNIATDASSSSSAEPPNSPVRVFDRGSGADIAFHALMHAACILKYQEYISTLHLIIHAPQDDGFLPPESPSVNTLDNLILKLRELRLVMEYVVTVLPSSMSASTAAISASSWGLNAMPIRSGSNASFHGSSSTLSQSYHSRSAATIPLANSITGNEAICQDFVERITRVIHNLPADMEVLKASLPSSSTTTNTN